MNNGRIAKVAKNNRLFDRLVTALKEGIQFAQGELPLTTTEMFSLPTIKGAEITRLRRRLKMTQGGFAQALNVSPQTVKRWEQGISQPSQAAKRLLQIIQLQPEVVNTLARIR